MVTEFNVHNLEFKDPEFHGGINTTFRLGDRWMSRVCIGDAVWLVDVTRPGKDAIVGCCEIRGKMVAPFLCIPHDLVLLQHDSNSRTFGSLYRTMKRIYKDKFESHSICTVLLFELI